MGAASEPLGTRLAFGLFAAVTTATLVPYLRNITHAALRPH
jgi:hypothetical protein